MFLLSYKNSSLSGVFISQKNLTTLPCCGLHGRTLRVSASGNNNKSDFATSPNPLIAEASNETPSLNALSNTSGI